MFIKFVRDDLKIFSLGGSYKDSSSWGITKLEGIGTIENDIATENMATIDGADIISERIPARYIDITTNVKNRSLNAVERRNALAFFNPKHSFKVYITKDGVTRWIIAKVQRVQCPENGVSRNVEMNLALICVDPFFYSADNYGKNIASVKARFAFPYISKINKGFPIGVYNFAKQISIENTGDAETYATIRIEAKGIVENPKIIQNDVYIRLIDQLIDGDVVEIDLVNNTIRKNDKNCIGKVDRQSSFTGMVLGIGDNTISFDADNGDTNMNVILYYNLRYLGA